MTWHFPFAGQLGAASILEPQFLHTIGSSDPLRQIAHMHELGFAGVTDNRLKHRTSGVQHQMGKELSRRGMRMGSFTHAPSLPGQPRALSWTRRDADARDLLSREMTASIEVAQRVGGHVILVTSLSEDGRSLEDQIRDFASNLAELAPRAEAAGLCLGLEGVSRERLAGLLLRKTTDVLDLIARVESPALALVFDSFHVASEEGDLVAAFRAAAPKVATVQLSDAPGRVAPGEGILDLVSLLREVRASSVRDPLIEMEFFPAERSAEAESRALAALRGLNAAALAASNLQK